MSGAVRLEREGRLVRLTLDSPPLNILDLGLLAELERAVASLEDDPEPHLVVVAGAGEKAFSAGVAVEDHTPQRVPEMLSRFHGALRRLSALPAISLAAVRGHCLGGGMELAAACDLVLADEGATFGQPEIELGCYPPYAAALYPARLGRGRTLELLLTGRRLTAAEAERLGFVHLRAPAGRFEEELERVTARLLGFSAPVARLLKRAVEAGATRPFEEALAESERLYLEELTRTHDMSEGAAAFLEKRTPRWRHE
ncbi:MAG: enoyl-CoA hydratase-related protein [Thermoanaerobaculia bacterium]|nr:enoyl-CoA hydratase-related protein [Thermoanaerobaculia bacterium]